MEKILIVSSILLWVGMLFNFLLILALTRRISRLPVYDLETLKPGTKAPSFQGKLLDGTAINQEAYQGKTVAFVFVGPHCQPCREFMPYFLEMLPLAREHHVEAVLVSESDADSMRDFLKEHSLDLTVIIAPRSESKFMEDYKVLGTPSFCLVDSQGDVKAAGHPGSKAEALRQPILDL